MSEDQKPEAPEVEEYTPGETFIRAGGKDYSGADVTEPADRTFREAWGAPEGDFLTVDMEKARKIWRSKIRRARDPEFERLDAQFMKRQERGEDAADIIAAKEVLRGAPRDARIDAAQTPEELVKVQPIPNVTVE